MLTVYIGYDQREDVAYQIAEKSLLNHSAMHAQKLDCERLRAQGLYTRNIDTRGAYYDFPSNAHCSTEFATSRFLVPIIHQGGWAMFADCDVVFLADVREILAYCDTDKAVCVVKHNQAGGGEKMDGMVQTSYSRKNWSSVMLFNCDHPSNRRLSLRDVNERPGRDLHRFYWLSDYEIGELPGEWNWLVNVEQKPKAPKIAHFTLGGPWLPEWKRTEHDEIWLTASILK